MMELFPTVLLDKGFELPGGSFAWTYVHLPEVLRTIAAGDKAILGGTVWTIKDGKAFNPFSMFEENFEFPVWNTKPQNTQEDWTGYCRRTLDESLSEISSLKLEEIVKENKGEFVLFRPVFAGMNDPLLWVPRDKHDIARAEAAITAGYPAVEPILWELLEWMQDTNWPVAQILAPFLAKIGLPLIPHIRKIFETADEMWKYRIISEILAESRVVTEALKTQLERIVNSPTQSELEEELDVQAREVLQLFGLR
jgi:hypothetical protein